MQGERNATARPQQSNGPIQALPATSMAPFQPHSAGLFVAAPGAGEWR